jgi:hypothetical protein
VQAKNQGDMLKTCPFCGKPLSLKIRGVDDIAYNPSAKRKTEDCRGAKPPVVCLDSEQDIIKRNTRA